MAMRKGRIDRAFRDAALSDLAFLDILVDDETKPTPGTPRWRSPISSD
jgi:hypothetical protein